MGSNKTGKNLYQVQDDDRPMFVIASSLKDAIDLWTIKVSEENDGECTPPPDGVSMICTGDDLLCCDGQRVQALGDAVGVSVEVQEP